MVKEHTAAVNRLAKLLEGGNIKLGSVVSNVNGRSARAMVEELVAGSADVVAMADLAKERIREKIPELQKTLKGKFDSRQRFVVAEQPVHLDYVQGTTERVGAEIAARMRPFEQTGQ